MRCLRATRCVTRADRLRNIKIREDTLPLNLSPDSEDSDGLGMFAVCKEIISLSKHTHMTSKDLGRPLKRWSDQNRNDTGLPLLTAERHAINRTEWKGATSRKTARVTMT